MSSSWIVSDQHVLESSLLKRIPWLIHGFGTRYSDGWPGTYTKLKQIHSDYVLRADGANGCVGEGDALVSATPGGLIGVRTADCVPLLFVDTENRVVAAVHAGWKGTVAAIASRTVEKMTETYGSSPERLLVAIGPSISHCCFEVGSDVATQFGNPSATHIDLVQTNVEQLRSSGVPVDQIDRAGLCTKCGGDRFHSFRRDRQASGRMVSAIGIRQTLS